MSNLFDHEGERATLFHDLAVANHEGFEILLAYFKSQQLSDEYIYQILKNISEHIDLSHLAEIKGAFEKLAEVGVLINEDVPFSSDDAEFIIKFIDREISAATKEGIKGFILQTKEIYDPQTSMFDIARFAFVVELDNENTQDIPKMVATLIYLQQKHNLTLNVKDLKMYSTVYTVCKDLSMQTRTLVDRAIEAGVAINSINEVVLGMSGRFNTLRMVSVDPKQPNEMDNQVNETLALIKDLVEAGFTFHFHDLFFLIIRRSSLIPLHYFVQILNLKIQTSDNLRGYLEYLIALSRKGASSLINYIEKVAVALASILDSSDKSNMTNLLEACFDTIEKYSNFVKSQKIVLGTEQDELYLDLKIILETVLQYNGDDYNYNFEPQNIDEVQSAYIKINRTLSRLAKLFSEIEKTDYPILLSPGDISKIVACIGSFEAQTRSLEDIADSIEKFLAQLLKFFKKLGNSSRLINDVNWPAQYVFPSIDPLKSITELVHLFESIESTVLTSSDSFSEKDLTNIYSASIKLGFGSNQREQNKKLYELYSIFGEHRFNSLAESVSKAGNPKSKFDQYYKYYQILSDFYSRFSLSARIPPLNFPLSEIANQVKKIEQLLHSSTSDDILGLQKSMVSILMNNIVTDSSKDFLYDINPLIYLDHLVFLNQAKDKDKCLKIYSLLCKYIQLGDIRFGAKNCIETHLKGGIFIFVPMISDLADNLEEDSLELFINKIVLACNVMNPKSLLNLFRRKQNLKEVGDIIDSIHSSYTELFDCLSDSKLVVHPKIDVDTVEHYRKLKSKIPNISDFNNILTNIIKKVKATLVLSDAQLNEVLQRIFKSIEDTAHIIFWGDSFDYLSNLLSKYSANRISNGIQATETLLKLMSINFNDLHEYSDYINHSILDIIFYLDKNHWDTKAAANFLIRDDLYSCLRINDKIRSFFENQPDSDKEQQYGQTDWFKVLPYLSDYIAKNPRDEDLVIETIANICLHYDHSYKADFTSQCSVFICSEHASDYLKLTSKLLTLYKQILVEVNPKNTQKVDWFNIIPRIYDSVIFAYEEDVNHEDIIATLLKPILTSLITNTNSIDQTYISEILSNGLQKKYPQVIRKILYLLSHSHALQAFINKQFSALPINQVPIPVVAGGEDTYEIKLGEGLRATLSYKDGQVPFVFVGISEVIQMIANYPGILASFDQVDLVNGTHSTIYNNLHTQAKLYIWLYQVIKAFEESRSQIKKDEADLRNRSLVAFNLTRFKNPLVGLGSSVLIHGCAVYSPSGANNLASILNLGIIPFHNEEKFSDGDVHVGYMFIDKNTSLDIPIKKAASCIYGHDGYYGVDGQIFLLLGSPEHDADGHPNHIPVGEIQRNRHYVIFGAAAATQIRAIVYRGSVTTNMTKRAQYILDANVEYKTCTVLDKIKHDIVKNGFYIPIFNLEGELIFDPIEFDYIRKIYGYNTASVETISNYSPISPQKGSNNGEAVYIHKDEDEHAYLKYAYDEMGLDTLEAQTKIAIELLCDAIMRKMGLLVPDTSLVWVDDKCVFAKKSQWIEGVEGHNDSYFNFAIAALLLGNHDAFINQKNYIVNADGKTYLLDNGNNFIYYSKGTGSYIVSESVHEMYSRYSSMISRIPIETLEDQFELIESITPEALDVILNKSVVPLELRKTFIDIIMQRKKDLLDLHSIILNRNEA